VVDPDAILALAAEIERRDAEVAATLENVIDLSGRADEIRARGERLHRFLDGAPAELAAIDRVEAQARDALAAAVEALAAAERRIAAVVAGRRVSSDARLEAEHELERSREIADEAATRLERLGRERVAQVEAEAAARAAASALSSEASDVVLRIRHVPRVSQSGREGPARGLAGLSDWAGRVHAALFVVRGQLEGERDRLVREANELGGSVFGEQLAGATIALVRRRLEEALRP
jgi:chromosome segregation ATPase